jgi:hypothetical protein
MEDFSPLQLVSNKINATVSKAAAFILDRFIKT